MLLLCAAAGLSAGAAAGQSLATLGGGCFWCLEAVFERIPGVTAVTSGYAGGTARNPTYEQVCTGTTGHAEVVQIAYDPAKISYEGLLEVFWKAHDPTTPNRQGADVGTQYRSIILYHDETQAAAARASIAKAQPGFGARIVTEVIPLTAFWKAEAYHQDYYNANRTAGYCRVVIAPKLKKLSLE
jgi:peptide-methionine (S)-S-oxide reductase